MRRRRFIVAGGIVALVVAAVIVYLTLLRPRAFTFVIVPEAPTDAFSNAIRVGCADEARRLPRVTCEVVSPERRDGQAQAAVIEALLDRRQRPAGIAVSPVSAAALLPVVQRATADGIPVITLLRDLPPDSGRVAFVGTDNDSVGIELARLVINRLPRGGTYAILTGDPADPSFQQRIDGVRKQFSGKGPYSLGTATFTEVSGSPFRVGEDVSTALAATAQVVKAHPTLGALVIVGPWPLLDPAGFRRAVAPKAAQIKAGAFAVVAYNLFQPELELVKEGLVTGLIGPRPDFMGRESVKLLYELARGVKPNRTLYSSGIRIVTKENVDFFLR